MIKTNTGVHEAQELHSAEECKSMKYHTTIQKQTAGTMLQADLNTSRMKIPSMVQQQAYRHREMRAGRTD